MALVECVISKFFDDVEQLFSETDAIARGLATLFKHLKIIVEPGGAVAVAAVLTGQIPAGATNIVAVASGGNIDRDMFKRALDEDPFF